MPNGEDAVKWLKKMDMHAAKLPHKFSAQQGAQIGKALRQSYKPFIFNFILLQCFSFPSRKYLSRSASNFGESI